MITHWLNYNEATNHANPLLQHLKKAIVCAIYIFLQGWEIKATTTKTMFKSLMWKT